MLDELHLLLSSFRKWRGCKITKMAALQFREEWENPVDDHAGLTSATQISSYVLRPFLFLITCYCTWHKKIQPRDIEYMERCFICLLQSVNSSELEKNYCSLMTGSLEERIIWIYQSRMLLSICTFLLGEFGSLCARSQNIVVAVSLAMRLVVLLTDLKGWKRQ